MITEKDYNKLNDWCLYNRFKLSIKYDEYQDIIHNFILERYDLVFNRFNKIKQKKKWDEYLFISFRFFCIDSIKKENKNINISFDIENQLYLSEVDDDFSLEETIKIDNIRQNKIECITNIVMTLNKSEQKLYYIYFVKNLSIRKIANIFQIHYTTIFKKIKQIKNKIEIEYENQCISDKRNDIIEIILKSKKINE